MGAAHFALTSGAWRKPPSEIGAIGVDARPGRWGLRRQTQMRSAALQTVAFSFLPIEARVPKSVSRAKPGRGLAVLGGGYSRAAMVCLNPPLLLRLPERRVLLAGHDGGVGGRGELHHGGRHVLVLLRGARAGVGQVDDGRPRVDCVDGKLDSGKCPNGCGWCFAYLLL